MSTPGPRRSSRASQPVKHYDNTPVAKKKKITTPSPTPTPTKTTVSQTTRIPEPKNPGYSNPRQVQQSVQEISYDAHRVRPKIDPSRTNSNVPPTMYSNQSLDYLLKTDSNVVGEILQKDIEDLRAKGLDKMPIKQLLSKNFRNYKGRPSLTSERATEIVHRTLSENDVPPGALVSGPPRIPSSIKLGQSYQSRRQQGAGPELVWRMVQEDVPEVQQQNGQQTLQSILEGLAVREDKGSPGSSKNSECSPGTSGGPKKSEAELGLDEFAHHMLSLPQRYSPDVDHTAYPGNHLPWQVIWKQVPQYTQGEMYCYVGDVTYTPIYMIIKAGVFTVPIDAPVDFVFNEKVIQVTLEELLTANGVNMGDAQHYRMLQGLFQKAGVHIRADYAERLNEMQMMRNAMGRATEPPQQPPIQLSPDKLPLMCIHPDIYMNSLGRRIHGAIIVDTSGDKEPLPGQAFLTTIYSEPLQFEQRRHILILHEIGLPIAQIAKRFGCTLRSVKETIGTRILIERHFIDEYFREEESQESTTTPSATKSSSESVGAMIRPKNKIRRTHYVDLNKSVWKHFKDCQATGMQINGKNLKDAAMRYAKQMGLESFRGSEGWLDAFKRRHRIDLKSMTGYPVCYENDMFDEVDKECRDLDMESHMSHLHNNSAPSFVPQHSNGYSVPDEFAASFFSQLNGFPQQMHQPQPPPQQQEPSSSTHLQNMINMMTSSNSMDFSRMVPSTSSENQQNQNQQETPETVNNVVRSCQIKIADKELCHAFDTLRKYILDNDPGAMSLLVQLQERLAVTSGNVKTENQSGPSTSS